MPSFSVIIPTKNRRSFVTDAIKSALMQELCPLEVIVVDDGSNDETLHALGIFGDRIKVLRTDSKGPGGARNAGARVAIGEYLAFLDDDDVWKPWALNTVAEVMRECGSNATIWFQRNTLQISEAERLVACQVTEYRDVLSGSPCFPHVSTGLLGAVRRKTFLESGGFVEGLLNWEDVDFAMKIGTKSPVLVIEAPRCIEMREHASQTSHSFGRIYRGARMLIQHEGQSLYPGGKDRRADRGRWLCDILLHSIRRLSANRNYAKAAKLCILAIPLLLRNRRLHQLPAMPLIGARRNVAEWWRKSTPQERWHSS